MNRNNPTFRLLALLLAGLAFPAQAAHGPLAGSSRDGWINTRVQDLVASGLVPDPGKPAAAMTNLEVAQLTALAAERLMAQASPESGNDGTGAAKKSLGALVEEFREELSAMELDLPKLEERIYEAGDRNRKFSTLQKEYLLDTGTHLYGYSRGTFDNYRGFGPNALYGPMAYNSVAMADIGLRSVPAPFVLFDTRIRVTRTIGLYYTDPINPRINMRWLSLSLNRPAGRLAAGDFYRSYTPLTLWNAEIPVHSLVEPTSRRRVRKNVEEMVFMDHGPDWRLRGLEASTDQELERDLPSSLRLQAMAGSLGDASPTAFAQQYAGSQASAGFWKDRLELKGAGLLFWDDTRSLDLPYVPSLPATHGKGHGVGSLSAKASLPIKGSLSFDGSMEWAHSRYLDDVNNPQARLTDWALLGKGSLNLGDQHLTAKLISNGDQFYSPGSQTNRYTPAPATAGYLATNLLRDDGLPGYRNNFPFQGLVRPAFAPYDRVTESILPYGDATPNRQGMILGFGGAFGKGGWIKPQLSYALGMREINPNLVFTGSGDTVVPVESMSNTALAREFSGYEGALTLDFTKALSGLPGTCALAVDFKRQSTDLGLGEPFTVETLILAADAGPFPKVPLLGALILSAAYEQARSGGREYALAGLGSPPTLAGYSSRLDTAALGSYTYQALNTRSTSWSLGFRYPLSQKFQVHGDWFSKKRLWNDAPNFDRREQIWRMAYELSF